MITKQLIEYDKKASRDLDPILFFIKGKITFANSSAEKLFGYSRDDLKSLDEEKVLKLFKQVKDYSLDEVFKYRERLPIKDECYIKTKKDILVEVEIQISEIGSDGEVLEMRIKKIEKSCFDDLNEIVFKYNIFGNVTEKQMQKIRANINEKDEDIKYNNLVDFLDTTIIYANNLAIKYLNLDRNKLRNGEYSIINLVTTKYRKKLKRDIISLLKKSKSSGRYDIEVEDKEGNVNKKIIKLETNCSINDFEFPVGVVGTGRDVTLFINTQKNANEEFEKLANIIDFMIVKFDTDYNILFANEPFIRHYCPGKDLPEINGLSIFDFVPEKYYQKTVKILESISIDNPIEERPVKLTDENGTIRYEQWTNTASFDTDGNIINYSSFGLDITKKMNDEYKKIILEKQILDFQHAIKISRIANGTANNLNNELQKIMSNASYIIDEVKLLSESSFKESSNRLKEYANIIIDKVTTCGQYIYELLLNSKKIKLSNMTLCNINTLINDVIDKLLAYSSNVDIKMNLGKISRTTVDYQLLDSAFSNICMNAFDAMIEKGDTLFIKTYEEEGKIKISFRDNGPGIPDEVKKDIFEPFVTIGKKEKGFGLSIVRDIIVSHEGDITLNSTTGEGTEFIIELPIRNIIRKENPDEYKGSKEKILVVDDDESIRKFVKKLLVEYNYIVDEAASGEEAIQKLIDSDHSYSVAILDIIMPGMKGTECLKKLKEEDPELDVIMMSGNAVRSESFFFDLGAKALLTKPVGHNKIVRTLYNILNP